MILLLHTIVNAIISLLSLLYSHPQVTVSWKWHPGLWENPFCDTSKGQTQILFSHDLKSGSQIHPEKNGFTMYFVVHDQWNSFKVTMGIKYQLFLSNEKCSSLKMTDSIIWACYFETKMSDKVTASVDFNSSGQITNDFCSLAFKVGHNIKLPHFYSLCYRHAFSHAPVSATWLASLSAFTYLKQS